VVQRRVTDLRAALTQHGHEWIRELDAQHAQAARAWQNALDLVTEAYAKLSAIDALRTFTTQGHYWAPGTLTPRIGTPPEINLDDALAALRGFAPVERVQAEAIEDVA
jgi:hypothetical protein